MFVGHFGPAFVATAARRSIPLWAAFAAVASVDVCWSVLVLLGIEKVQIIPGASGPDALDLYYMPYTHSFLGALFWAVAVGFAWYLIRGRAARAAAVILGAAAFSHWVLDWLVHRPDLPFYDDTLKVGLGLWSHRWLALVLELALLLGGMYAYLARTQATSALGRYGVPVFCGALVVIQAYFVFGPALGSGLLIAAALLALYVFFAAIAAWLGAQRVPSPAAPDAQRLPIAG